MRWGPIVSKSVDGVGLEWGSWLTCWRESELKLKFGVFLDPIYLSSPYSSVKEQALEAERLGYESVWISDHLMSENKPVLECFTTLSAFAAMTQTIRLGSLVACTSYRRPSILAKIAATLDVVSKGRLEFGIGAGWNAAEYRAYGIPFPKPSIRIAQMREGVELIKRMWTEEHPSFTGQYFQITRAHCEPKPIQKPHPPITIGGSGEKLTLKVVAEYADRSNWSGSVSEFAHKLEILKAHCSRVGRHYDAIEKSWFGRVLLGEDPQALRKRLKQLYGSGRLLMTQPQPFDDWAATLTRRGLIGSFSACSAKIRAYAELGVTYFMLTFLDSPSTHDMNLFSKHMLTP